jgi:hypothetical protein
LIPLYNNKLRPKLSLPRGQMANYKHSNFSIPTKTMSAIKYDGRCAKCGRGPVATGIPVFRDLEAEGTGKSGTETVVFCIDCVRRLLHQEGEDEVVAGG